MQQVSKQYANIQTGYYIRFEEHILQILMSAVIQ